METPYPPPSNIHIENRSSNQITFARDEVITLCPSLRYIITAINCGVCPNSTTDTNITCVLYNVSVHTNHLCIFAVQTEICGYLIGERSTIMIDIITYQGPEVNPPWFKLKFHYPSSKNATVEIVFTDAAIFEGRDSSPISYTITCSDAPSGRVCGSATIPASSCLSGVCCHMFGEVSPPCSPSGDVSISAFATNILGDGPASHPLIFSLKASEYEPTIDSGRDCYTTREFVSPVAGLAITLIIVIAVFTVTTAKLWKDKANMERRINTLVVQNSRGTLKRNLDEIVDYENTDHTETATKMDIEIKENPAYSTVKEL